MASTSFNKSAEWTHKRQPSALVLETIESPVTDVPSTRVTSGPVFDALMQLRAVLKEPEKHPRETIIFAKDS